MGKKLVAAIIILLAVNVEIFSANDMMLEKGSSKLDWPTVQRDVKKLSRNSFYEKYSKYFNDSGLKIRKQGRLLSPEEIRTDLQNVWTLFFKRGYSQANEVKSVLNEFNELNESSSGAYAVLRKRVYDLNIKFFRDKSIAQDLRREVNDDLSDLFKKIEKNDLAISSVPTMATMISILAEKTNSGLKDDSAVKSTAKKRTFSLMQLSYVVLGSLTFVLVMFGRAKVSHRLSMKKIASERSKIVPGLGLKKTGVLVIDKRGRVESMNIQAEKILLGHIHTGDSWDRVFQKNFFGGKKHMDVKGFYRFVHSPKHVYHVNGRLDKTTQKRMVEISQMTLKDFDQALTLLERSSIRVDSMELLDDVFSDLINLNKISLSLDLFSRVHFGRGSDYLYLSAIEGKKYLSRVLKIVDTIASFKPAGRLTRIDIDREGSDFNIVTTFSHCSLKEADLDQVVRFDGQELILGDVLNSFQKIPLSYECSLIVKNLTLNAENMLELKFKIQDNSKFQSVHRKRELGKSLNV